MDNLPDLISLVILNLPNFAGLVIALVVISRQNEALTNALIEMTEHCMEEISEDRE